MLPPWSCQCSWDFSSRDLIPVYVRHFQPLWRSWSIIYLQPLWRSWSFVYIHHGDSNLCILYMAMTTYVIFCIMPIHGHCTLMYQGLLYVFVVMCRVWLLYYTIGWLDLPSGSSSTHFWDGFIMYFGHHVTPLTSHIRGICYNWFYHTWLITHLWPSLSLYRLFGPHGPILYPWCFQYHP